MDPFGICIGVAAVVIIVAVVVRAGKGFAEWADNNRQPVLTERATIVAKRSQTSGSVHQNTGGNVATWYYATFELSSGDRREFSIGGKEYGMLADGDEGLLTYQGTRYHGFERRRG